MLALTQTMERNVSKAIEGKCSGLLKDGSADGFLECSAGVSREHVRKIGEYVKFAVGANEAMRKDVREWE